MQIAVLGAGSWGTTLAVLLESNAHDVTLWSYRESYAESIQRTRENPSFLPGIRIPESVLVTSDLVMAAGGKEMIVTAIPSQYLRNVMKQVTTRPETLIVNVAKGIENTSLMTMSEVLKQVIPAISGDRIATLSGPSHAEEVSLKTPTTVVVASTSPETSRIAQSVFMTPYFRVYNSMDLRGVELGGALKNVIAIAAGIVDGASLGDNTKAALMTRGIAEITRLGVSLGADQRTFAGLSGIGDLMVTCMSRHSRNRHVGVEIGKGRRIEEILGGMVMIAEGVATTRSAFELAQRMNIEVPIIAEVYKILFKGKDPLLACSDLMTRDPKEEA